MYLKRIIDGGKFPFTEELQLITEYGMIKLSVHHLAAPNGSSQWSSIIAYIKKKKEREITRHYVSTNSHTQQHL